MTTPSKVEAREKREAEREAEKLKKLIVLAARSAGAEWSDYPDRTPNQWLIQHEDKVWREWDPANNDGDAFKMQVKLKFLVQVRANSTVVTDVEGNPLASLHHKAHGGNAYKATRYAILRAAAAVTEITERNS